MNFIASKPILLRLPENPFRISNQRFFQLPRHYIAMLSKSICSWFTYSLSVLCIISDPVFPFLLLHIISSFLILQDIYEVLVKTDSFIILNINGQEAETIGYIEICAFSIIYTHLYM